MNIVKTSLPGLLIIEPNHYQDERGSFIKTFVKEEFEKLGLVTIFHEEYYSVSQKGVLRGLHFQTPPFAHDKMIFCTQGQVLDVCLDLRIGSSTYGNFETFLLDAALPKIIYIPRGLAHGFYSMKDGSTLLYKVTGQYSKDHDEGILWSSISVPWPNTKPIISKRDASFPALKDFKSPFRCNK